MCIRDSPEALFTVPHAIARNKLVFSLAQAAFVLDVYKRQGKCSPN